MKFGLQKVASMALAVVMIGGMSVGLMKGISASAAPEVIQLNDSAAWSGDESRMETVGTKTNLYGETGAVYTGLTLTNELIEFKMKSDIDAGGWTGLRFRSDLPANAPWDNTTGYFIKIDAANIDVMRQGTLALVNSYSWPDGMGITDGSFHKMTVGVYDAADGKSVHIVMKVDDQQIFDCVDSDEEHMTAGGSSVFSTWQYGAKTSTDIEIYADESSTAGGIVDRDKPVNDQKVSTAENWFINGNPGMSSDGGVYTTMENAENGLTITGKGGVSYRDSIDATVYSFTVSMNKLEDPTGVCGPNGSTLVLFRKQDRNTANGTNSYGLKISTNGRFSLVSFNNGKAKYFPAEETDVDFTQPTKVTVEVIGHLEDEWYSDVYVYLNSDKKAYKYRDRGYNPSLEAPACFGVLNTDFNVTATISDISHNGTSELYEDYEDIYPVYGADVFSEEDKDTLHFEWRSDYVTYTKAIITTENGKTVGEVKYPNQEFDLKDCKNYKKLYITAVDVEGKRAEAVEVDLTKKYSDLYVDHVEQIVVKKEEGKNASFMYKDSGQTFVPQGVNYVGIRFGDHATFEPANGLIPAYYDPYKAEAFFRDMKENGYNFVRVFVIPGGRQNYNWGLGGNNSVTEGIYIPYMENVCDFISRAAKYGVYVMPCFGENEMVSNRFFRDLSNGSSRQSILFSNAGIKAKQKYIEYFLEYIKQKDPELLKSVLGLSMQNEFAFEADAAPFNQLQGNYTFLDGSVYDMSNDDDRRALANRAIENYYAKMKETIESVAPGMLLSEGTYSMLAVGKTYENSKGIRKIEGNGDLRFPMTAVELLSTSIDFLDMHVYRYGQTGSGTEVFEKNFKNMKLDTEEAKLLMQEKPVVLGEFGAFSSDPDESTLEDGIAFTKEIKEAALKNGFSGYAYWTMDTFEQTNIWNLTWDNYKGFNSLND